MSNIVLSGIVIYPIKSLAGIAMDSWPICKTGFKYDRQWMLIDQEGQFLSQRILPRMAIIKTAIQQDDLIVSAPGQTDLQLSLQPQSTETVSCTIWHDNCAALSLSKAADDWFSDFLNYTCRLVYLPEYSRRPVDLNYAKASDQTAFSDGFPFLLVSENSLTQLNQEAQMHLEMARFRPNLIVSGCSAYAEDGWRNIRIGDIEFRLPKPCSRCVVPTINPETGETGKEPLTTLNRTRKWQNKVYFGQNALHNQCGQLTAGDKVTLITSGVLQPPL